MTNRDEIARQALALPPEDRSYLADVLEQSLTSGEFASPEIAAKWSAEIDRRLAAYDRGEVQATDFQTTLESIRARLAKHRSSKVVR